MVKRMGTRLPALLIIRDELELKMRHIIDSVEPVNDRAVVG